jgi:uncharacterized membrane protein
MESKAKFLGHPIHPMLIVFPFGLFSTAVIFDIIRIATNNLMLAEVSFWLIAAGIVGGLLAAIFGFIDFLAIPTGTRARAIGAWHGAGNFLVVILFTVDLMLRGGMTGHIPEATAQIIAFVAILIALGTGWLGGELVDRLGVGVDHGANLNAPNSLSGRPASDNATTTTQVHSTRVGK